MSSLRDLIARKARRTATFSIPVGDVAAADADVAKCRYLLVAHQAKPVPDDDAGEAADETARLQAELDAAIDHRAAAVVRVQLQALPDAEWDAALDELPIGEDGGPDISDIRAALMAACCVDPDLQDETWWSEQLTGPAWSKGELLALNTCLLTLNLAVPAEAAGKG